MTQGAPDFEQIVGAFNARERAIRYKVRDLVHTVEVEKTLGTTYRKLSVETTLYEPSAARIRWSIWEDGSVWLAVEPSIKGKGWQLHHKIETSVEGVPPEEVIRRLERTVQVCGQAGRGADPKQALAQLWSRGS
jgi:hypothetical protein